MHYTEEVEAKIQSNVLGKGKYLNVVKLPRGLDVMTKGCHKIATEHYQSLVQKDVHERVANDEDTRKKKAAEEMQLKRVQDMSAHVG